MPRAGAIERAVFLNCPFDKEYEPLFVALICSLVALGRTPRSVLEMPEVGDGRLARIISTICECPVSIHDLSRAATPVRFNMPFELGVAVALARTRAPHQFIVLESERFRLQRTLSDLNGIDPGIHNCSPRGMISCVLSHLGKPSDNPLPQAVFSIYRELWKAASMLKKVHGRSSIYSRAIFSELVKGATMLANRSNLITN